MQNTTNVALSRLTAQQRALDVTAGNIANANTPGYRAERLAFSDFLVRARGRDIPQGAETIHFTQDRASFRDRQIGPITHTANTFDIALVGDGYFQVETPRGPRLTRAGHFELSATGNVSGDGLVTAALVGSVPVLGLTPQQAAQRIGRAYKDGQFLVDPQVTVTMTEYQSQQLSVLGEVTAPGRFPMRTRLSILDALALAGGIKATGAQLAYILRPEDAVVTRYEVDLDALLQAGAGQQYFELLAGDTVVVPKSEVFYIYGEVKTPNAYPLKSGTTVIQALSLAGGLTDKGSDRRIDIKRRDDSGRLQTLSATLNDALRPDDVVYIRERLF